MDISEIIELPGVPVKSSVTNLLRELDLERSQAGSKVRTSNVTYRGQGLDQEIDTFRTQIEDNESEIYNSHITVYFNGGNFTEGCTPNEDFTKLHKKHFDQMALFNKTLPLNEAAVQALLNYKTSIDALEPFNNKYNAIHRIAFKFELLVDAIELDTNEFEFWGQYIAPDSLLHEELEVYKPSYTMSKLIDRLFLDESTVNQFHRFIKFMIESYDEYGVVNSDRELALAKELLRDFEMELIINNKNLIPA